MEFVKGTIIGLVAGAYIGYMKNDMIYSAMKKGKKELKNLKKKMCF